MPMPRLRIVARRLCVAVGLLAGVSAQAQTNPTPLNLPVSQDWGGAAFTTLPTGFAAWNGLSGFTIDTQAEAEASAPAGDAVISGTTPVSGGTGGCYGYAPGSDGRFAVLTSSNAANGVNQLAMAINTAGLSGIALSYDLINVVANTRLVGVVCQYRVGNAGAWTSLSGTNNPYVQSGGVAGTVTPVTLALPPAADNQPLVQIRWAVWRGTAAGSSSGFGVDNVSVIGTGGAPLVAGLALSGGPSYNLAETAIATVTLSAAPATTATVSVASGAFATATVTIEPPETSGTVEVSMATAGTYTATATAVSNCAGSANSGAFNVVGAPAASFAATGNVLVDDSGGNGDGYIDPGETVHLTIEITNNGTANATGVSAVLTSLTPTAGVVSGASAYPDLAISAAGNNIAAFSLALSPSHVCGATINLQLAVAAAEGASGIPINSSTCPPSADPFDAPPDYYLTALGTGATLKANLHNIISKDYWNGFLSSTNHRVSSYDDAKIGLQITDVSPNNPNQIILIYTGVAVARTWDGGTTWNREHQWPNNRGLGGGGPDYSDLQNLRPCNPSLNSSRGDKPYGTAVGFFDPDQGAPVRGDVARSMFYMDVRYDGGEPNTVDLSLANGMPTGNQMGDLAFLLASHYADLVSLDERRRNHAVFSNVANPSYYQGNRNPFVDRPEYVWTIFGAFANDATLYVGPAPAPDGSSSVNVDLGRILVGAAIPAPQSLALNKTGAAPTTYEIALGGGAASNAAGRRQAFIAGAQSRSITAGLQGPTAPAGARTGSVIIDNTDLTSAAAGQGAADSNDVVNVVLAVLDHANASFSSPADANTLTIDFGGVAVGGSVALPFAVHNLVATPGFTAGLDLLAVVGGGDTAVLSTDAVPFVALAPGGSAAFSATFAPVAPGSFSATYTLQNADELLPGRQNGANLVLTLVGVAVPGCNRFDVNCDSSVNVGDIPAFVDLLLGRVAPCAACAGDINGDAAWNGLDIQGFVANLLGP